MNRTLEIDKAEKDLKEATDRLGIFKAHVNKIENEIFALRGIEKVLVENIAILKSDSIIAIASEFKKAKDEIEKLRQRLSFLNIDLSNHQKAIVSVEKHVIQCREAYAKALLVPMAKVIRGNFRSNSGQE